jgi:competence protein ComEC
LPLSDNVGDNDASLVTRITFAGTSILLCSDIEQFAQQQLMALYPNLTAQIVVAPHHGSTSTLDAGFLPSLSPEILLVSRGRSPAGRRHPAPAQSSATLMATGTNGAVTVCVEADDMVETATYLQAQAGD